MDIVYDLIVLGSGGAGYQVAMKTKEAGWNVALVNKGPFGGTCSVRGCIPKKVLAGSAEVADLNRRLKDLGVIETPAVMDWPGTIKFKKTFTDPVPASTEKALRDAGIDVFIGNPKFVDKLKVEVNGKTLEAKQIHIAVGAEPARLQFEGSEHLITSDDFLDLENLPKSIVFVGGGYVSFEFAHVAARYGSKVTILESSERSLKMFDEEIVEKIVEATREIGIEVVFNSKAQKIEQTASGYTVFDGNNSYEGELIVNGAGRPPGLADLNLEAAGVEYDTRKGITVDKHLKSVSNPNIYAAGDVANAGPPLSPVAGVQGGIVADNLLGKERVQPSYMSTSSVIFTTPTASKVGLLEPEADKLGLEYDTVKTDSTGWFDAKRLGQKYSLSKVLVEKETHKIIGAHLVGNHADDLINIFSLAVEFGLTTEQLKQPIMAFPTSSDDMRYMF